MPAPRSTSPPQATRRDRHRQATTEEIKAVAHRQLADHGPAALSLRAIAREMGMASSGLYRYFASADDLISALCVDAYNAAADALTAARDAQPPDQPAGQWWAICHAYRRWSLDHRPEFTLIFGTPLPGYRARDQATGPAASRLTAVALDVYAAAVHAGAADPDRTQVPPTAQIGDLMHDLLDRAAAHHPPRLAAVVLTAWASLLGYLVAEIFGSLPRLIDDTDQLYRAHLRTVMLGMGFHHTDIQAAEAQH